MRLTLQTSRRAGRTCLVAAAVSLVACAARAETAAPAPSLYEVEVRLQQPAKAWPERTVFLCLPALGPDQANGLQALSPNLTISGCPGDKPRVSDGALAFRIACPGDASTVGEARFEFDRDGNFEGRIETKLDGQPATEFQTGRKIGACRG